MEHSLSYEELQKQNISFSGTAGVSRSNYSYGFFPAFFDKNSKLVHISTFSNGLPAPIHVLAGVPEEWVKSRDAAGHVTALIGSVIAGFIFNEQFYTRKQAASLLAQESLN